MKKFAALIAAGLFSLDAQALSPKQYCELLEQRQSNSFEMLNMTPVDAIGSLHIKFCKHGKFCILQISSGNGNDGVNHQNTVFQCAKSLVANGGAPSGGGEPVGCPGSSFSEICN